MNLNFKLPAIYWKGLLFALSDNFYPYIKFNLNHKKLELTILNTKLHQHEILFAFIFYQNQRDTNMIILHFPAYSLLLDYKATLLKLANFCMSQALECVLSYLPLLIHLNLSRELLLWAFTNVLLSDSLLLQKNILTLSYLLNKQNCSPVLAVNEKKI